MASTSSIRATAPASRPPVKRACNTWPGDARSRNHFEDFLREIGASSESAHLCCVPHIATTQPHVHTSKRSASNVRSKARLSNDKVGASSHHASATAPVESRSRFGLENRGRTLSSPRVSGTLTTGLPISLKSPALSSMDLENHDAPTYSYLASARDALLSLFGAIPVDERPSRSPTRSLNNATSAIHSADSQVVSRPSQPSSSRTISSESGQRSRMRSSPRAQDRSSSRTPSIDSLDTASSSEAPATPRTTHTHELPTLEDIERTSRYRVQCVCKTCKRAGSNFPHCGKCGERWCSRECRMGAAATHACHGQTVSVA